MTRCIYQQVSVALKISLLSCSLPLLLSSNASSQEQNCTQAQIQANIAKQSLKIATNISLRMPLLL